MHYFNNAATSYPKPPAVADAVAKCLSSIPHTPYREAGAEVAPFWECREHIASFFGSTKPERVILTSGATASLNMLINGLIRPGSHIITSQAEHNSVLRPLQLAAWSNSAQVTCLRCGELGAVDPELVGRSICSDTSLVVLNHTSNVTGYVQDLKAIYSQCARRGVPLVIDAAQFSGSTPVLLDEMPLAAVVFAGHKGLGGPGGVGGFVLGSDLSPAPWLVGGTGILSELQEMPKALPLRYEPGVPNDAGMAGLTAACRELRSFGPAKASEHLNGLVATLRERLADCPSIRWYAAGYNPSGIASFTVKGWDVRDLGYVLENSFGCLVRTGLHCAPLLHSTLGTYPQGTIRVSFSRFTTVDELELLIKAIREIGKLV